MAPTTFNSSNGRSAASEREGGRETGRGRKRERDEKRGRNAHVPVAREFWSSAELGGSVSQGLLD